LAMLISESQSRKGFIIPSSRSVQTQTRKWTCGLG
jgi:hypothetical protein